MYLCYKTLPPFVNIAIIISAYILVLRNTQVKAWPSLSGTYPSESDFSCFAFGTKEKLFRITDTNTVTDGLSDLSYRSTVINLRERGEGEEGEEKKGEKEGKEKEGKGGGEREKKGEITNEDYT